MNFFKEEEWYWDKNDILCLKSVKSVKKNKDKSEAEGEERETVSIRRNK